VKFDRTQWDAVLFDLDGVLTQTAKVHSAAWQQMFDEYLERRAARMSETFVPFDPVEDYKKHIDGKPRYDGVRDFLASRGIVIDEGAPTDAPDRESICGLGNRKNDLVVDLIENQGVETYESSVRWVRDLREAGMKTAVVSASKNCQTVLDAAGIADLFDYRVDGVVATERNLAGKPAPDPFLEAARGLGVTPERSVVVEDAIAGVASGRAGGFGLVIGVDRKDDAESLRAAGADVVVRDLGEIEY
jgi:alpha,alpha-trehalase